MVAYRDEIFQYNMVVSENCAAQFIHLTIFIQLQFIIYNQIKFKLFSDLTDVEGIDQSKSRC